MARLVDRVSTALAYAITQAVFWRLERSQRRPS